MVRPNGGDGPKRGRSGMRLPDIRFTLPKSSIGELSKGCIQNQVLTSRRQLTPVFDKPAFSRFYASQTKILENETAGRACLFEVLCEGVSTRFGRRMLAKSLENTPKSSFGENRFSHIFQPRLVVHSVGKIVKRPVCQKWG